MTHPEDFHHPEELQCPHECEPGKCVQDQRQTDWLNAFRAWVVAVGRWLIEFTKGEKK